MPKYLGLPKKFFSAFCSRPRYWLNDEAKVKTWHGPDEAKILALKLNETLNYVMLYVL